MPRLRRRHDLPYERRIDATFSDQGITEKTFLDFELFRIWQVLPLAASAFSRNRTMRHDPLRSRFKNLDQLRFEKVFFDFCHTTDNLSPTAV